MPALNRTRVGDGPGLLGQPLEACARRRLVGWECHLSKQSYQCGI